MIAAFRADCIPLGLVVTLGHTHHGLHSFLDPTYFLNLTSNHFSIILRIEQALRLKHLGRRLGVIQIGLFAVVDMNVDCGL